MMEYYEPTSLFRQNAVRRTNSNESGESQHSHAFSYNSTNNSSTWLLNQNQASDTSVMNKACSLDRVNIKSNYWKIPDAEMNLTALAVNDSAADVPLLAISSANSTNNLFIHELDSVNHYLTHHTTISLPNIHSLAWVPNTNSRYLISGNNKGYAHLVSIPRPSQEEASEESAEIVKRFNHRKHLRLVNKNPSIHSHGSTCISELGFLADKLVTCYDDTLFVWNMNDVESSMRPKPESISIVSGIRSFDPAAADSTTLALCGAFGLSLFDTRTASHSVPKSSLSSKSRSQVMTNKVKWHPQNEHILASAHADGAVRLWDIRKQDTFAELTGHCGKTVTSMSWNGNDLFTGANDGNIVHWDLSSGLDSQADLSSHGESLSRCSLREGIDSVKFDTVSNSMVEKVNERQCGTVLPASNNKIVSICPIVGSGSLESCSVLSIDGAAFLGLHNKIYDAARPDNVSSEKLFYTPDDLNLIRQEGSSDTFVASSENLIRPLSIARRRGSFASEETLETAQEAVSAKLPKASFDVVSVTGTEDFDFGKVDASREWDNISGVVSLHSIDSSPEADVSRYEGSPYSSGMSDSGSNASVSTVATLIGPVDPVMQKESSFQLLDLELERICNEFPSAV
ncbi:hypothetical protein OXX69_005697 [Metschnikowia pulcherrima]